MSRIIKEPRRVPRGPAPYFHREDDHDKEEGTRYLYTFVEAVKPRLPIFHRCCVSSASSIANTTVITRVLCLKSSRQLRIRSVTGECPQKIIHFKSKKPQAFFKASAKITSSIEPFYFRCAVDNFRSLRCKFRSIKP